MAALEFPHWAQTASFVHLSEEAASLARAFLYGDLHEPEREHARLVLTALLDHPSVLIRQALAENLASAPNAPHYMVLALANDRPEVASIVLSRSPLLSDAELAHCTAMGGAMAQRAVAVRPWVSARVAAALADGGCLEAAIALACNPGAELPESAGLRLIERFGHEEALRAALLARPNLSSSSRCELAGAAARAASAMAITDAGLSPERAESLAREARERAIVEIAARAACEPNEARNLVSYLRRSGQLTAGLLLRSLLCGNKHLFELALCELTGVSMRRVSRLLSGKGSAGFASLYRKAGIPRRLRPLFVAALDAVAACGRASPLSAWLQAPMIDSALRACASIDINERDQVVASLRRLEVEAAREEVREFFRAVEPVEPDPAMAASIDAPSFAARMPAIRAVASRRCAENAEWAGESSGGFDRSRAIAQELAAA